MKIIATVEELQTIRNSIQSKTLGFVPTMGNLHAGHLSLCERSRRENDLTIVSIFVNPTQFNQEQDFNFYPRTLANDLDLLRSENIDFVFNPSPQEIYNDDYQIQVTETNLSLELEGKYRPGHFNGMLTVVLKLLNLIQPSASYFGEKDYQQLLLIKKMVVALFLPIQIIACKTIRAEDGLALSSRNTRLSEEQRHKAAYFPKILQSKHSTEVVVQQLEQLDFQVDYIIDKWQRRLGAVWLDDIRLIDNFAL